MKLLIVFLGVMVLLTARAEAQLFEGFAPAAPCDVFYPTRSLNPAVAKLPEGNRSYCTVPCSGRNPKIRLGVGDLMEFTCNSNGTVEYKKYKWKRE